MKKNSLFLRAAAALVLILAMLFASSCMYREGKSAYEIAVEHGFVGTEEEWLESLKGKDGTDGTNGKNGKAGESPDIYDIYERFLEENPGVSFTDFLKEYLDIDIDNSVIENGAATYAANRAMRSAVSIFCGFSGMAGTKTGSGVIYSIEDNTAYIITNYHVVYNNESETPISDDIKVFLFAKQNGVYENADQYAMQGTFIGGSMSNDIAIVRVEDDQISEGFAAAADIQNSNDVAIGSMAIAIGNPLIKFSSNKASIGLSVTSGVISVDSETIEMPNLQDETVYDKIRVMRIDTAVNRGNSGGGLFNSQGKLIGIVNAKIISSDVENVAYAIPSNVAAWIADSVIAGNTKKARMGIEIKIIGTEVWYDTEAHLTKLKEIIAVHSVTPGSLADTSGILVGDIFDTAVIDGVEYSLDRMFYLPDLLFKISVNDTFTLNIIRNGTPVEITVTPTDMQNHFVDF